MKDPRNDEEYRRWIETTRRKTLERDEWGEVPPCPCIRVSNGRYAQDATFEDRLTLEDKQLLSEMGIAV